MAEITSTSFKSKTMITNESRAHSLRQSSTGSVDETELILDETDLNTKCSFEALAFLLSLEQDDQQDGI